ncbi:MAG: sulfite exporter TauE/SafE family protein [Pseudomonadota bacterium]
MDLGALTLPPEITALTLAAIAGVYLLAGLVKGATGFGLPVVSVTLLPFFVPIDMALALNAIVITATNLQQIRQAGEVRAGLGAAWPMMLGMAIMVPIGAQFTVGISATSLMIILGTFVLLFVISSFLNPSLKIPSNWHQRTGFGMGLLSGVVGAITSAPGPIFVSYVHALHLPRPIYMAALGFIMLLFGFVLALSFIFVGLLRWEHVLPGLLGIPPAIFGMWLGNGWGKRLPVETFRKVVLALLGVLAVMIIRRAIG